MGEATDTFSNEVPPQEDVIILIRTMHKEVPVAVPTIRDGHHHRLGIVLPRSIVDIVMMPEEMIIVVMVDYFIPITSGRIEINTEVVQVHLLNHNVQHNVHEVPQGLTEAAAIEISIRGTKRIQPRPRRLRFHRSK